AEQKTRPPCAGGLTAQLRRGHADQQADGGDGEHGGADTARGAEHHQLPVFLRERTRDAACRDNTDSPEVHGTLPEPGHQFAAQWREYQSYAGKGADHRRCCREADVEAGRECRQGGGDQAITDGDQEASADKYPDLPRQPRGWLPTGCVRIAGRSRSCRVCHPHLTRVTIGVNVPHGAGIPERSVQRCRRPNQPSTAPRPMAPRAPPTPRPRFTRTFGRMITGGGGCRSVLWFSAAVAVHAVMNNSIRETRFANINRPSTGPNTAKAGLS